MKLEWQKAVTTLGALMLVSAAVMVSGCSSEKPGAEAPAGSTPAAAMAESSETYEHGEATETMKPAADIAGIWTQIGDEQTKLSAAIQNGQLKDVHHLAFGIRDLVEAVADKAKTATPALEPKLEDMVKQVKASAGKLDELGDAGNLSGTQAEYAKFQTILSSMQAVAGK